jgi:hypothetical protein
MSSRVPTPGARADLGRGGRIVAACLAAVWLGAGVAAMAVGVWFRPGVLPILLGVLAAAYGWLWWRVAVTGERLGWPSRRSKGRVDRS